MFGQGTVVLAFSAWVVEMVVRSGKSQKITRSFDSIRETRIQQRLFVQSSPMASLALLVLFLCVAAPGAVQSTPQRSDDTINVFLVPHSHDDVGWTETVYQYYTGTLHVQTWSLAAVGSLFPLPLCAVHPPRQSEAHLRYCHRRVDGRRVSALH